MRKSIWRTQVPVVFAISLFGSAFLSAVAGALAAPLMHVPAVLVAAATLACWFLVEVTLCLARGWPLSVWTPFAFFGREVLDLLVWLRVWTTSEVNWAGVKYPVSKSALAAQFDVTPATPQGAGTNDVL